MPPSIRLEGLDVARFFALIGMVFVNFDIVMTGGYTANTGVNIAELLQGRAVAVFVVLAGIGLGLANQNKAWAETSKTTLKRTVFLMVVGLLNALIFEADIIHYYAIYFFLALFFLRASSKVLWICMIGLVVSFACMVVLLDYDAGWDWETLTYSEFWTPSGFFRNLFFNGWHPVIPWFAFILFGLWLSRLDLRSPAIWQRLVTTGAAVFISVSLLSKWLKGAVEMSDPEAAILFSTSPIPPFPLYMIAGASFAALIIGFCLFLEGPLRRMKILHILTLPGRQTLTLYIAHIVFGMGLMEALGMIGGQTSSQANIASILFCFIAVLYCVFWAKKFSRGPLEMLMRRLT